MVVAEGAAHDADALSQYFKSHATRLGFDMRVCKLGHVQRGGAPTPFDRVLATRFGYHAAQLLRRGDFGRMVTLQGDTIASVAMSEVAGKNRTVPVDHPLVATARGIGVMMGR